MKSRSIRTLLANVVDQSVKRVDIQQTSSPIDNSSLSRNTSQVGLVIAEWRRCQHEDFTRKRGCLKVRTAAPLIAQLWLHPAKEEKLQGEQLEYSSVFSFAVRGVIAVAVGDMEVARSREWLSLSAVAIASAKRHDRQRRAEGVGAL